MTVSTLLKPIAINTAPLSFFRFFAACVVIFFHFGKKIEWYPQVPDVFKSGSLMVTFFFVLSGYSLYSGYCQREFNFWSYLRKRAVKILPLYYLAFVLMVFFQASSGQLTASEFVLNLFGLQAWFPQPLSLNFTSWFVSALLFFYAIFPAIVSYLRKSKPESSHLFLVSMILWGITQISLILLVNSRVYATCSSRLVDVICYFPLSHFCSFFMGICGAYAVATRRCQARTGDICMTVTTLILFLFTAFMVQTQPQLERLVGFDLPFSASWNAPLILLLMLHLISCQNPLLKILSSPRWRIWGELSYALFILQAPIDWLYNYALPNNVSLEPAARFFFFFSFLMTLSFMAMIAEKRIVRRLSLTP